MILECYVEGGGSGSYTYEWRKDSRFLTRGQRLTVDKLETSTAGGYECIVSGIGPSGQVRGDFTYNMRVLVKQTETKICERRNPFECIVQRSADSFNDPLTSLQLCRRHPDLLT